MQSLPLGTLVVEFKWIDSDVADGKLCPRRSYSQIDSSRAGPWSDPFVRVVDAAALHLSKAPADVEMRHSALSTSYGTLLIINVLVSLFLCYTCIYVRGGALPTRSNFPKHCNKQFQLWIVFWRTSSTKATYSLGYFRKCITCGESSNFLIAKIFTFHLA